MSSENGTADTTNMNEPNGLDEGDDETGYDIVVLEDDEGNTMEFAVLDIVEVDEQDYALLVSVEQIEDEAGDSMDILIFQYDEEDDGVASFSEIEDEAIYERVREHCATMADLEDVDVSSN